MTQNREYTVEELSKIPKVTPPINRKEPDLSLNEVLVILPDGLSMIHDWEGHVKRLFKLTEKGTYIEITPDYRELAKTLAKGLDPVMFLEDVIRNMDPDKQAKLAEMLKPKIVGEPVKPKTRQDNRCAHLQVIAGGHTMTINLRG